MFVASFWDKNEKKTASFEKLATHTSISNLTLSSLQIVSNPIHDL